MKNEPAFPHDWIDVDSIGGRVVRESYPGMTIQQYAAIKLRVPNSGLDWLDDMIRQSLKNEWAGQAMGGILQYDSTGLDVDHVLKKKSMNCLKIATAMLTASEAEREKDHE